MLDLRANTSVKVVIGPAVAVGDGFTPVTNLTLSGADEAELMKHDASSVTDISGNTIAAITGMDGYYNVTLTAGNVDTEGMLVLGVNDDSLILPIRHAYNVMSEAAFDAKYSDGTGAIDNLGIVDHGTAQSATGTTLVLRSAAGFADDELIGATILITGGSAGVGQSRIITDYTSSTDTATVDTWTTTPTGTITYIVFGSPPGSTSSPAPADVRQFGGTNGTFSGGRPEVNTSHLSGTAQTARDLGASVLLSNGTGTGQISLASGEVTAGSLGTQAKADVNAEVVDTLATDTYAEPGQETPAATNTLAAKINYLFKAWRNRSTQTSTTYSLYNDDATTVAQKSTVSDDGTTFDRGEVGTGP